MPWLKSFLCLPSPLNLVAYISFGNFVDSVEVVRDGRVSQLELGLPPLHVRGSVW